MEKMISYIFGTLQVSEQAFVNIAKALKTQNLINKSFALFTVCCATYAITTSVKIDSLNKEIEELKKMKGE